MLFKFMIGVALMVSITSLLASAGVIAERKLPKGLTSPIEGYALVEPIFEGHVLGKHFKLNGTVGVSLRMKSVKHQIITRSIQEVYTKLEKIHGVEKLAIALKHTPDLRDPSAPLDKVGKFDISPLLEQCLIADCF